MVDQSEVNVNAAHIFVKVAFSLYVTKSFHRYTAVLVVRVYKHRISFRRAILAQSSLNFRISKINFLLIFIIAELLPTTLFNVVSQILFIPSLRVVARDRTINQNVSVFVCLLKHFGTFAFYWFRSIRRHANVTVEIYAV